MFFLLLLLLVALLFVYVKLKYFTLYGSIPGRDPQFFFGNILQTGMANGRYIGDVTREFQEKYGDTFQMWLALVHVIFVCNPDDVQYIFTHRHIYEQGDLHVSQHRVVFHDALICNLGAKYKRHAAVILPLFRRGKVLNNLDLIVDCTDQLLNQWRSINDKDPDHVHLTTVDQCQNLSLAIFGLIAFDYDLQTLESSNINQKNKLTIALNDFLQIFLETTRLPNRVSELFLKVHPRYRRARATINKYLNQIIEQELRKSPEQLAEHRRTSLIASLVTSLQENETVEGNKPEHQKKGQAKTH